MPATHLHEYEWGLPVPKHQLVLFSRSASSYLFHLPNMALLLLCTTSLCICDLVVEDEEVRQDEELGNNIHVIS